jgi:hypothetical protein
LLSDRACRSCRGVTTRDLKIVLLSLRAGNIAQHSTPAMQFKSLTRLE